MAIMYQSSISAALSNSNYIASQITTIYQLESQYSAATGSDKEQIASQLNSLNKQLNSKMNDAYDSYNEFTNLSIFLISYFINNIFQIIFAKLQRKIVEIFTYEQIANFILFFVVLNQYFKWKFDYSQRTYSNTSNVRMQRLSDAFSEGYLNCCTSSSIMILLLWSRVTMVLRLSKIFGPMIEIVGAMIKELMVFAVLFGLVFSMFMFTGKILFFQLDEFNSFNLTAQYLFYA